MHCAVRMGGYDGYRSVTRVSVIFNEAMGSTQHTQYTISQSSTHCAAAQRLPYIWERSGVLFCSTHRQPISQKHHVLWQLGFYDLSVYEGSLPRSCMPQSCMIRWLSSAGNEHYCQCYGMNRGCSVVAGTQELVYQACLVEVIALSTV